MRNAAALASAGARRLPHSLASRQKPAMVQANSDGGGQAAAVVGSSSSGGGGGNGRCLPPARAPSRRA